MNHSEQLTELRDALRGIRSELSMKALKDYISVFLQDSELKSILIADDVERALWYCLWNNSANRQLLIEKLYNFFMAPKKDASNDRKKEEVLELISMVLFLGGVDFQMNKIEIEEEVNRNDTMAVLDQSQKTVSGDEAYSADREIPLRRSNLKIASSATRYNMPVEKVHNLPKRNPWLVFAICVIFVALIGVLWLRYYLNKQEIVPIGNPLGTVVSTGGTDIILLEHLQDGVYSLKAVSKKRNGKFVEENVFQTPDGKQSVISAMKSDKWFCSNPDNNFFAFNEGDSSLYVPLSNRDVTLADRFIVYQFDGQIFKCKSSNSAGYWLRPSLQDYDCLFAAGQTGKYLVRIDRMADGSFRYASWNKERDKTIIDEPDIVLFNDGQINNDKISFRSGFYKYIFDYGENNLWVINDKNDKYGINNGWVININDNSIKVLYCHNMEILYKQAP